MEENLKLTVNFEFYNRVGLSKITFWRALTKDAKSEYTFQIV